MKTVTEELAEMSTADLRKLDISQFAATLRKLADGLERIDPARIGLYGFKITSEAKLGHFHEASLTIHFTEYGPWLLPIPKLDTTEPKPPKISLPRPKKSAVIENDDWTASFSDSE